MAARVLPQPSAPAPAPAPALAPAPARARAAKGFASGFTGIAALGAVFGGVLSHHRNPDLLTTGLAVGLTFVGALVALYLLHAVFRVAMVVGKVVVPVALLLFVGCALDWPWAERAVHLLHAASSRGLDLAQHAIAMLRNG